mmetsp:Transcript_124646/g.338612  ORF Transcript_124646/g.338612 Transcript_124646/m.338612 type:complete len:214 (-) Transcript_124646:1198-1839(-)
MSAKVCAAREAVARPPRGCCAPSLLGTPPRPLGPPATGSAKRAAAATPSPCTLACASSSMRWPRRWSVRQSCSSSAAIADCSLFSSPRISDRSSAAMRFWTAASSPWRLLWQASTISPLARCCSAATSSRRASSRASVDLRSRSSQASTLFFSVSWLSRTRASSASLAAVTAARPFCCRSRWLSTPAHLWDSSWRRPSTAAALSSRHDSTSWR